MMVSQFIYAISFNWTLRPPLARPLSARRRSSRLWQQVFFGNGNFAQYLSRMWLWVMCSGENGKDIFISFRARRRVNLDQDYQVQDENLKLCFKFCTFHSPSDGTSSDCKMLYMGSINKKKNRRTIHQKQNNEKTISEEAARRSGHKTEEKISKKVCVR